MVAATGRGGLGFGDGRRLGRALAAPGRDGQVWLLRQSAGPNVGCETIVARGGSWPLFWALLVLALVTLGAAAVIWLTDREQRAAS